MYELEFITTNNTAEYEALLLGLRAAKYLGIQQIYVYGDSELVVQQVSFWICCKLCLHQMSHPR